MSSASFMLGDYSLAVPRPSSDERSPSAFTMNRWQKGSAMARDTFTTVIACWIRAREHSQRPIR